MINVSIIVPTRNRSQMLEMSIKSLISQNYPFLDYEIIIVDNGSHDNTKNVVEKYISTNPNHNIRYIFEPVPGLLSGRHRGAFEAKGDILIFVDDDIIAKNVWLLAIMKEFQNVNVHMVGGPCLPFFELEPPEWIFHYFNYSNNKITCGALSILKFGVMRTKINPRFIWGLNFSIRKKTLFDLGGFHPDGMPQELIAYRGDGETGLSQKAIDKGINAMYVHEATVYHYIPKERLTVSYFEKRFYNQGISDSYTQIRNSSNVYNSRIPKYQTDNGMNCFTTYDQYKKIIYQRIHNAYVDGFHYHQQSVKNNKVLLKWVLSENYFNYDYKNYS